VENNEYAQILDNDPSLAKSLQNPDDEYGQIADQAKEIQKQSLQQSAYVASKGDPERKAEALRLAKEMKLPADLIERNLEEVKKQRDQKQFGDYTEIIDKTPGLAKWLQDPDNATLAKDDLDGLKKTEGSIKEQGFGGDLVDAFKYGAINLAASLAKSPALMAEQSPNAGMLGLYEDSYSQFQIYENKKNYKVPEELYKNDLTRYLDEKAAKFAPKDIDASIVKEASDGNFQKAGRAFAFQVASNLPQLGLIVATRGAGLPVLGLSSASEKNVQNLEAGVSPDLARSNALVTGAIETGIESIGGVGADTFKSSIKTMVKSLGPQSAMQVIKESVKQITKTGLEEGAEEWTTTVAQGILDYGSGIGNVTLEGVATDAVNSFIVGAGSGVATHGITLGAEGTSQAIGRYSEFKKAESARDAYAQMGEVSVDSKLRQRSPEKHAEYLAEVTAGTPSENIYIPIEDAETYFQSKNINPVQFMQSVGAIASYNEAKETGADIKIPFAEWTAKTIDTEHYQGLADDIKFQPESSTVNQAKRSEQDVRDDLKLLDTQAKEAAKAEQDKKKAESTQKIFDNVKDMLVNAGRSETEAKALAQVFSERYAARAENRGLGEDPFELFQKTGLEISKVDVPDKESFFGKLVDGAKSLFGAAQSQAEEKSFNQSFKPSLKIRPNKQGVFAFETYRGVSPTGPNDYGVAGKGEYTSGRKDIALTYANGDESRVTKHRIELNKPLIATYSELNALQKKVVGGMVTGFDSNKSDKFDQWMRSQGYDGAVLFDSEDLNVPSEVIKLADNPVYGQVFFQSVNDRPFQTEIPYPEKVKNPDFSETDFSVSEAKEHFTNAIQGTTVKNSMTGWDIDFSAAGKKKAGLTLSNEGNRIAYANIDGLMESAILGRTEGDRRGGEDQIHFFYAPFTANEKDYVVSIKVRETNDGKKFYDKFVLEKETPRAGATEAAVGAGVTPSSDAHLDQTRGVLDSAEAGIVTESAINIDQFIRDVKSLQSEDPFFQGAPEDAPRGRIRFKPGIMSAIELFQHADRSTVIHESGHLWFNELIEDATTEGVPQQLKDDLDKMLVWVGATVRSSDGADAIRVGVTVDMHEQMARGFEAYLMEGKAPTQSLRKIFAKFKVWLTAIYQRIENLNVPINDDVREVFARLVAGDEAIRQAEQDQAYQPLFIDPIAMGMNPEQAERYDMAIQEARQASEDYIRAKLMEDVSAVRAAFLKRKPKEIRAEVTAEAHAMPVYQMISILETGKLPGGVELPEGTVAVKISRESVEQVFGKAYVEENLSKWKRVFSNDGLPYDMVAEAFGYTDGESMIQDLAGTVPMKEFIETKTQARIAEEHPDLLTSPEINEEAIKAVHNDKRAQMLRMELEHMAANNIPALKVGIKQIARRVPTEKQVREQAAKMIGEKAVGEIKPHIFLRAEVKAAKEAGILFAMGDIVGAFESKRKELLNHELYRASVEATERVEKDRKKLKKLFKKDEDIAKTRDVDMVNAGRAILAQFGLTSTDKTAAEYLEPIQKYDPETYQSVMALVESATENAGPYKTVSYDSFVAMSDAVQAIWDLAKSSREMEIDGLKIDRNIITGELSQRLDELIPAGPMAGTGQALTDAEKRTLSLRSVKNLILRVEHWANAMDKGDINGVFTKYIVRPILNATTQYRLAKDSTIKELSDIVKTLDMPNPQEIIDAPEISYKFTKPELIMALLHTGNESNFKKLLVGRGWGVVDPDGKLNTSRWDTFFLRAQQSGIITKNDMDVVQKIWDLNEKLKPDAQKAHKRMYGYYFNEITSHTVRTSFGDYRGGYMPAIMDANISLDANIRAGQDIEESPAQMFPTTGKGFTKNRDANFTTPLSLDFGKIASHLDKVLKFTYIEPAVKDAARLVNDRGLRSDLNAFDNSIANELLIPWLKRAATQRSSTPGFNKTLDRGLSYFRRVSAIQFMVLNVQNMFQNLTATFPALVRVSGDHMAGAFKRYLKNPKETSKAIMEASPYMKTRSGSNIQDMMKDIDEVILNPSKFQSFKDEAINKGYVLERATNGFMEMVVWDAAHNQALAKGLDAESAVREADATVRQTQAAMNPEDIAQFESGTPFVKLFTMFSGFFNTQANLNLSEITKAKEEGFASKEGSRRLMRSYAFALAAPAIVSTLIARVMGGGGLDEDDDGEYFDDILDLFFGAQVKYALAMTPGGSVLSTAMNVYNDKPFDDKINVSPALSNLEKALSAPASVYKAAAGNGSESKAIKEAFTALGLVTGLPLAPVAKPLSYASDVRTGKAKPSNPVDFSRGLVTGRPGGK